MQFKIKKNIVSISEFFQKGHDQIIIKNGLEKLLNCLDLHFASASDYQCRTCETKPNLKKIFKIDTVLAIDKENMFLDYKIKDTDIPNEVIIYTYLFVHIYD